MKDNQNIITQSFLGGMLFGVLLGGTVALLFAPRSGRKFRKNILKTKDDIIDDADHLIKDIGKKFSDIVTNAKKSIEAF
ncbi:MAG: YtxH domain-containing protein [Ignavibacteria bacterium]|nr:YtxH domain-containing protein [Ignavibacteria bacterium]